MPDCPNPHEDCLPEYIPLYSSICQAYCGAKLHPPTWRLSPRVYSGILQYIPSIFWCRITPALIETVFPSVLRHIPVYSGLFHHVLSILWCQIAPSHLETVCASIFRYIPAYSKQITVPKCPSPPKYCLPEYILVFPIIF